LADEKTQTRRIVKPQPKEVDPPTGQTWTPERKWLKWKGLKQTSGALVEHCPYGQPEDVLWVREAFQLPIDKKDMSPKDYVETYRQYAWKYRFPADGTVERGNRAGIHFGRKRPSIHMPRELCRLRLRVKDVRVERVQEISAEDALNEGISDCEHQDTPPHDIRVDGQWCATPIDAFAALWDSIHGDGAWEENPWVWVVEFSTTDTE